MSTIQGYYYLHVNKELIYKNNPDAIIDIRESDLCESAWAWDGERKTAWQILVESLALGAKRDRVMELAEKWKCYDDDALKFAERMGVVLGIDGNRKTAHKQDFINLQESECGFGDTYLDAMADLCKRLGYAGGKMWKKTFEDILAG